METQNLTQKIVSRARLWVLVPTCALILSACGGGDSVQNDDSFNDSFNDAAFSAASAAAASDPNEPELAATLPELDSLGTAVEPSVSVNANDSADLLLTQPLDPANLPFDDALNLDGVHSLTTLADTGIRVGFKGDIEADSIDPLLIESSWAAMQSCLEVVAVSPLVIVSSDVLQPLSNADDVLFHFDGSITATSTRFAAGVTMQVSHSDLDGTLSRIGFNLRSVMGRYLWESAGLPERDYPHSCASQG